MRPGVVLVVLDARAFGVRPPVLPFATRRRAERVELGAQVRLGLDEAAAVVPHRLVAGVGVLRRHGDDGRHQHNDEQDGGKDGIVDEENDAHDTGHDFLRGVHR